jgi:hypothetical protein
MPYDTAQGQMYQVDKIVTQLTKAQIDLPFPEVETPGGNTVKNLHFVTPSDDHEDVKGFTQFVNLGTDQEPKLVLDGRPYMRWDRRTDTYRLTAENDWMFQSVRGALTLRAMKSGAAVFDRLGDIPLITFVKWITRALVGKFNLEEGPELKISVVAAFYFLAMSDEAIATDPEARMAVVKIVNRVTKVDYRTIGEISDNIKSLKTLSDLAKEVSTGLNIIRLGDLKAGDIWVLVASSFQGVNNRENVGVALEHLPTFIAMVYVALADKSYRKYTIGVRALSAGTQREQDDFKKLVYLQVAEQFK